jgi:hypothetical protein
MKIDLGRGAYLEPDEGPRNTRWHMRIERSERIPCSVRSAEMRRNRPRYERAKERAKNA